MARIRLHKEASRRGPQDFDDEYREAQTGPLNIAAMSAKSRKPDTESLGIDSRSVLASSRLQTGVLPFLTTYFGPRTECAGFDGVILAERPENRTASAPQRVFA
jgi:hypothetical protein